jgi:hypothetical protein
MRRTLYLIANFAYPIHTYLQKNWKSPHYEKKKSYDNVMNLGRMVFENVFGTLKNMWPILKHLNSRVNKTPKITITCCWLHNNYELWN